MNSFVPVAKREPAIKVSYECAPITLSTGKPQNGGGCDSSTCVFY